MQTVYVPVKASERMPNLSGCYFASTNLSDGEFLDFSDKKWYGDLRDNETVQVWLEPTEAVLLSKEDSEKIKETEKHLTERLAWCERKIEILMGALQENNIPEPMLNTSK